MRKLILAICFSFCLSLLYGQNRDSLWQNFSNPELSDSIRLAHLHFLARSYVYNIPDSGLYFARMQLEFAEEAADSFWIAAALNNQAIAFTVKSDFAAAFDRFTRSLDIRILRKDSLGIAASYNNIGNIYYHQGDFVLALECFNISHDIDKKLGNERGVAITLTNIGSIYAQQDEFQQALHYFRNALKLYEQGENLQGMASCYTNLATVYKSLDSLDQSRIYFSRSTDLFVKSGDEMGLAIAYADFADLFRLTENIDSMLIYYSRSEKIRNKLGDRMGLARLHVSRGSAYARLDRYAQARNECQIGYDLAKEVGALPEMHDACECLYEANKELNKDEIALQYLEQKHLLADSMEFQETRKQLQLMEFRQQIARDSVVRSLEKARLAASHAKEIRSKTRSRNILFVSGVILLGMLALLYQRNRRVRASKKKIEAEKQRSDDLLLSILPAEVTRELLEKGKLEAREFPQVTVLFTDFIGFTDKSKDIPPAELVTALHEIFRQFDEIIGKYGIMKIKTTGDSFMAAAGLPVSQPGSVRNIILAAMELQEFIEQHSRNQEAEGRPAFHMRVGLHHGPVIAGIVGFRNYQYDIWGDTVNLASRIERHGKSGQVNISRGVYEKIASDPEFSFEERGAIEVKGKGPVEMWFVRKKKSVDTN